MSTLSAAIVLFLIMDPFGNAPIFLGVLDGVAKERRKKIILREMLIALAILTTFLYFGNNVLRAMNITAPALSISGGVVLFLIAIRMIFPRRGEPLIGDEVGEPLIVPLAMPLIAGPSAMAMVVLFSTREPDRMTDWLIALLIAWGASAVILLASELLSRLLKERGLRALTRLMGMILTAVAVQMLLTGITEYLAQTGTGT